MLRMILLEWCHNDGKDIKYCRWKFQHFSISILLIWTLSISVLFCPLPRLKGLALSFQKLAWATLVTAASSYHPLLRKFASISFSVLHQVHEMHWLQQLHLVNQVQVPGIQRMMDQVTRWAVTHSTLTCGCTCNWSHLRLHLLDAGAQKMQVHNGM